MVKDLLSKTVLLLRISLLRRKCEASLSIEVSFLMSFIPQTLTLYLFL